MAACLEPAPGTDADFDAWYRQEHCAELAKCTGYVRTRRYELTFARQNRLPANEKKISEPPKYLALHEFDLEAPITEELMKTAETEWAKKVMGGCVRQEVGVYRVLNAFGDVKAKF
jgi:hypothetical protein